MVRKDKILSTEMPVYKRPSLRCLGEMWIFRRSIVRLLLYPGWATIIYWTALHLISRDPQTFHMETIITIIYWTALHLESYHPQTFYLEAIIAIVFWTALHLESCHIQTFRMEAFHEDVFHP